MLQSEKSGNCTGPPVIARGLVGLTYKLTVKATDSGECVYICMLNWKVKMLERLCSGLEFTTSLFAICIIPLCFVMQPRFRKYVVYYSSLLRNAAKASQI